MRELNWYSHNGVKHFKRQISPIIPNNNGVFIVANKYGKVTYVKYGNIRCSYKIFHNMKKSLKNDRIDVYTYAICGEKNSNELYEIINNLKNAFYHNPEYNESIKIAQVPKFGIFSSIYKKFYFETKYKTEAEQMFIECIKISDHNDYYNKLEIKLTKNNFTGYYLIFFRTMYYFDIEYKIKEKFVSITQEGKNLNENFEIIDDYGEIKDEAPIIL